MLEGKVFYWIAWSSWIFVTFFFKKTSSYRTMTAFCILLVIIFIPYHVKLSGFQFNIAALFLYCLGMIFLSRLADFRLLLYHFIAVCIVMLSYASFLLFELYDPVWVLFPRDWMLAAVLVYISVLLHPTPISRLFTITIGTIQGEILVSVALNRLGMGDWIGELAFFDMFAVAMLLLFGFVVIERWVITIARNYNQQGKEKQKTT